MGKDRITDAAAKVGRTVRQAARKLAGNAETRPMGELRGTPAEASNSRARKEDTAQDTAQDTAKT